jgi:hypothetical protein
MAESPEGLELVARTKVQVPKEATGKVNIRHDPSLVLGIWVGGTNNKSRPISASLEASKYHPGNLKDWGLVS